jgi:hypothetical protein
MARDNILGIEPTFDVVAGRTDALNDSGVDGLARRLHSLLLMERGTIPNNYDIGIGTQLYSFEILDDPTLADMRTAIMTQMSKYVTTGSPLVKIVMVERMATYDANEPNSVLIAFELGETSDAKFIGIVLRKDRSTSKMVSEIVIH